MNFASDSDEDTKELNIGWRKGQPPRSDVVVKLTKHKQKENTQTAAERVANKILVGPIHKIPKVEPKLPPLKFGSQQQIRVQLEDISPCHVKRHSNLLEAIKETSTCPNNAVNKALVTQTPVKQGQLILEEADQKVEEVDEEVTQIMGEFTLPVEQVEHRSTPNPLTDGNHLVTTQVQSKLAPSPKPVNPFITPKLPNISVKPPDLVAKPAQDHSKTLQDDVKIIQEHVTNVQDYTKSVQDHSISVQGYTKPVQDYTKPVQDYTKPVQDYTKPVQDYTKPVQDYTKPGQDYTKPLQEHIKPNQDYTTPVQEHIKPKQDYSKPIQDSKKPTQDHKHAKKAPKEETKAKNQGAKKKQAKPMPDLIKSAQPSNLTSEEVMNEMIQTNQLIPKEILQDIIAENKNLPDEVIAEIPMVKAAIEYNFKHEDDLLAAQLERIPTPFRKFYEAKNRGDFGVRETPAEKPSYWNNAPKPAEPGATNPFLEMSKLRSDVKKHKEQQKAAQLALVENTTEDDLDEAWYKDESDEFQQNLKDYHSRYILFF